MKKSAWYVPFLALALATSAYAQGKGVETCKDRQDTTVKVMVCIDADVDWVSRSVGLRAVVGGGENAFEYNFKMSWHIDMTDKVSVFASMAIPRNGTGGAHARLSDGATSGDSPTLYDLNVKIMEVWDPGVTLSIGTQNDLVFSIRGNGQSLFFAPGSSNRFGDNNSVTAGDLITPSTTQQVTGIVAWYKREAVQLAVCILPAIYDGNTYGSDESAYALFLYYDLATVGKGSRLGFIVSSNKTSDGSDHGTVLSFGGGASLKDLAMPGSEIFVEFYVNSGDAEDSTATSVKAKGLAFIVGFKYVLPNNDAGAWAEISFTSMSGDDGSDADSDYYESYGNVSDLVIIEDQTFGFHVSTNCQIIKIMGGMGFTAGSGAKNNVQLKVAIGLATTSEDIGNDSKLGTEIDVKLSYWYSKAVSIDVVIGMLSGSDILDTAVGEKSANVIALGINIKG